jgi:hypothetical protein
MNTYIKNSDRSQINNNNVPRLLEKQEQAKPNFSKWKEIIKMRAEISEMKSKKYTELMKQKIEF